MGEWGIGQPVPRFEDPRLVRGEGNYVADMTFPGTVPGYVLRSPHAHARIKSIDTSKAKAAPGVLAVLTGEDWDNSGFGDLPVPAGPKRRDGSPLYRPRYRALARDRVRWVGDYVAFVVAETVNQAMDAAELIEVDYESLPAVVSAAEAIKPGAPLVWDDCPNNITFVHLEGDKAKTDEAFAKADKVVKHRFVINRVTAASMEPRGSIGVYRPYDGHYTIYTTLQRNFTFREELCKSVLKVPEHKVRVVSGDIGGSFGMKSAVYNEVALVLWAAKVTGRPVKWISTRSEAFLSDGQARDNVTEAELALDKDGNFLGLRVNLIANVGAFLQVGGQSFVGNLGTLAGVYKTPAVYVDVTAVLTNTNPVRPYRGNGRPEAAYVIERMVDLAADELGVDPAELRRKNSIPPEAMPFKTGLTFTYDSGDFAHVMEDALELADIKGFEKRRAESKKRGKLRGIGMSNTIERAAAPSTEGAEIRFDRGGTMTLFSGSNNQGQGHETAFKQIVCDKLGVDPKDITYISGDTDAVFYGEGTGGSRSATHGRLRGPARDRESRRQGQEDRGACPQGRCRRHQVRGRHFLLAQVQSDHDDRRRCQDRQQPGQAAEGDGARPDRDCHLLRGRRELPQRRACLRGRDRRGDGAGRRRALQRGGRRRYHHQSAPGVRADHRRRCAGHRPDPDGGHSFRSGFGQLTTGSFMDYAMPRADDISALDIHSHPVPTPTNPLGVKGCGEAGCVGAMPAVANAIVDALSVYGVRHIEMPATPERVWRAIQEARPAAQAAE